MLRRRYKSTSGSTASLFVLGLNLARIHQSKLTTTTAGKQLALGLAVRESQVNFYMQLAYQQPH